MELPHHPIQGSPDNEPFSYQDFEDQDPETLASGECPSNGQAKRQFWFVQVRNSEGEVTERPIKVRDMFSLPHGEMVIIPFEGGSPSGTDASGLLGGFLGRIAQNHRHFPISFKKWPKVLQSSKDWVWTNVIKAKLWWDPTVDDAAKVYIMKDIGNKWKEYRKTLFDKFYSDVRSREENIKNPPFSIPENEWAAFIDYRLDPKTKVMCEKNAENRAKLTINHTGGSKKLKRKMSELMAETGQPVSRGTLYIHTHKRKDGTYINEEAQIVCEKISEIESQGTAPVVISPNDSLGQVFGKEHPGRVRGVGFGVCPSQVFGCRYQRFCATSSNTSGHNRIAELENKVQELQTELKSRDEKMSKFEALLAHIVMNSSIHIPPNLTAGLDIQTPGGR